MCSLLMVKGCVCVCVLALQLGFWFSEWENGLLILNSHEAEEKQPKASSHSLAPTHAHTVKQAVQML